MNLLELLKRIPQEHFTDYDGKYMSVRELRELLEQNKSDESRTGKPIRKRKETGKRLVTNPY